jgi:hypothetical protein
MFAKIISFLKKVSQPEFKYNQFSLKIIYVSKYRGSTNWGFLMPSLVERLEVMIIIIS